MTTHLFNLHLRVLLVPTLTGIRVTVLETDDVFNFPPTDECTALTSVAQEILYQLASHTEHFCPASPVLDFQWRAIVRLQTDTGAKARTLEIVASRPEFAD